MRPSPSGTNKPHSFGVSLRVERERQQLSLRQLGRLIGADASTILLWERDETLPKTKYLVPLARALELPTHELFAMTGAEYPHDAPTLPAMLRAEYDLPPEAVAEIEKHITKVAKKYGATKRSTTTNEGRNL